MEEERQWRADVLGGRFLIRADGNFQSPSPLFQVAIDKAQLDKPPLPR